MTKTSKITVKTTETLKETYKVSENISESDAYKKLQEINRGNEAYARIEGDTLFIDSVLKG